MAPGKPLCMHVSSAISGTRGCGQDLEGMFPQSGVDTGCSRRSNCGEGETRESYRHTDRHSRSPCE
jgi:hypothetical protein